MPNWAAWCSCRRESERCVLSSGRTACHALIVKDLVRVSCGCSSTKDSGKKHHQHTDTEGQPQAEGAITDEVVRFSRSARYAVPHIYTE